MNKFMKSLTIVAVTNNYKVQEHVEAILKTAALYPYQCRQLIICDKKPEDLQEVEWEPLTFDMGSVSQKGGYSKFILQNLDDYISTDYCIIVQHDGYAINKSAWTDEFFNYDYIGAPFLNVPILRHIFPRFNHRVGNGGFSMRSKLWLSLGKEIKHNGEVEDMFCTQLKKNHWIKNGCKIAPVEIASRFAIEYQLYDFPKFNTSECFGFHGFLSDGRKRFEEIPSRYYQYSLFAKNLFNKIKKICWIMYICFLVGFCPL